MVGMLSDYIFGVQWHMNVVSHTHDKILCDVSCWNEGMKSMKVNQYVFMRSSVANIANVEIGMVFISLRFLCWT